MTTIEWTRGDDGSPGVTWNPTTGCDRVSDGCDNCYALTLAKRLKGMGSAKYQRDGDPRTSGPGFGLTVHEDALGLPLRWRKSRRVFVNSMSDLFHSKVPDEFIARVFAVMAATPQHTYQILTKRHGRMRAFLSQPDLVDQIAWEMGNVLTDLPAGLEPDWGLPLPNVWLGVSVEDQKRADLRIPALLDTPAAVRFLSCEPLLGPVDLARVTSGLLSLSCDVLGRRYGLPGQWQEPMSCGVDWVIVGGESGPGARPMHPDWARQLRDQCQEASVPFFFKQWGAYGPAREVSWGGIRDVTMAGEWTPHQRHRDDGAVPMGPVRKNKHTQNWRLLDGRTWDEYPIGDAS